MLGLIVMVFALAMAGGCAKKVASTPEVTTVSGSGESSAAAPSGLTDAQRLAEQQRQAIDKLAADRIYFAFDKSDLTEESRQALAAKADLLKEFPALTMLIEGHCDERGTNEYNMALGERRARAAYDYLVMLGIEPTRLTVISYGEEYPAVPGSNEASWAKNRRDEFKGSTF
jgi:peptidoglycan-associated lipoprotein